MSAQVPTRMSIRLVTHRSENVLTPYVGRTLKIVQFDIIERNIVNTGILHIDAGLGMRLHRVQACVWEYAYTYVWARVQATRGHVRTHVHAHAYRHVFGHLHRRGCRRHRAQRRIYDRPTPLTRHAGRPTRGSTVVRNKAALQ